MDKNYAWEPVDIMRFHCEQEDETRNHAIRVAEIVTTRFMDMIKEDYPQLYSYNAGKMAEFEQDIYYASLMHDSGKLEIPKDILYKPTRLSLEEQEVMKAHSEIGKKVLEANFYAPNQLALSACTLHHKDANNFDIYHSEEVREVIDYFQGKLEGITRGQCCDLMQKFVDDLRLADMYDAIRSERCYKKEKSHEEASFILNKEWRKGKVWNMEESDRLLQCAKEVSTRFDYSLTASEQQISTNMNYFVEHEGSQYEKHMGRIYENVLVEKVLNLKQEEILNMMNACKENSARESRSAENCLPRIL